MRKDFVRATFVLLARLLLGGVFVVASIDKIADPAAFAVSIGNYRLVPYEIGLVAATVLPWLELFCGLALVSGIATRGSALLTCMMLILFTAGVASALARGLDISCGCFTQDTSVGRIGWTKLAENGGLLLLSAFLYSVHGIRWSIAGYLDRIREM